MGLSLVTVPAEEPVSLSEARLHLSVDGLDTDTLVERNISAARIAAENFTNRALCAQTWDWTPSERVWAPFVAGEAIKVPLPPLVSITHIKYLDSDGAEQTFAPTSYRVSAPVGNDHGKIALAYQATWPSTRKVSDNISVRFIAGYGDADSVPETIKQATLLILGNFFLNRESVIITGRGQAAAELPQNAEWLLIPYREVSF